MPQIYPKISICMSIMILASEYFYKIFDLIIKPAFHLELSLEIIFKVFLHRISSTNK